jgi:hydroxymethylpyrimidine kinase/phosphomethylpyrimidine kinase/thiamine-phosphate diphosphorylase
VHDTKTIIWTLSGADCSGGAGIAADIKTGHVLGAEVCHLITANTVQNSQQLIAINPVLIDILTAQVNVLINDKPPKAVKIGLIASNEQLCFIVNTIKKLRALNTQLFVVYDPVGSASVGGKFNQFSVQDLIPLLKVVDVVTPNLTEAKFLTTFDDNNIENLAIKIKKIGVKSVIIKGGHQQGNHCVDYCLHEQKPEKNHHGIAQPNISYQLSSAKINTRYSHGGGCSFATALAVYLAQGHLLRDAFTLTKAFINQGLAARSDQQDHYGAFEQLIPSSQGQHFPIVTDALNQKYQALPAFSSLDFPRDGGKKLGLYPVVDSVHWLKRLLPLGLRIIQLRLKNKTQEQLESYIKQAVKLSKSYQTRLIINDYWQLAIKYRAYGVHIGQEDIETADLSAIQASGLRLGISTHGCYEFLRAQQLKPSYLAVGAIFSTKTKDMSGQIQGIENLQKILTLTNNIPVVAIGGINHQRAEQVWQTGVDAIAVVTAISESENPEQSVADFIKICHV